MTDLQDPKALETALAQCAEEPVHIPGMIQPVGEILAYDRKTLAIHYVSSTIGETLGLDRDAVLGASVLDILGPEVLHGLRNAASHHAFDKERIFACRTNINGRVYDIHAFASGAHTVVEIEEDTNAEDVTPELLGELTQLMARIQDSHEERELLDLTVSTLKTLTGYDRVMAYRFDEEFNGEVIAESYRTGMDPFKGLRFPHWDIPAQARAIMARLPMRFICDTHQVPVRLLTMDRTFLPLDITLANLRGVSPVHMQYLRNMDIRATMTLSVMVADKLWGMISFHHRRPRVPSTNVRKLCLAFLPIFCSKLQICLQQSALNQAKQVDVLRSDIHEQMDEDLALDKAFEDYAPRILETFNAAAMVLNSPKLNSRFGINVSSALRLAVVKALETAPDGILSTENIATSLNLDEHQSNGLSGVLAIDFGSGENIALFRPSRVRDVNWAGQPDKTIEVKDGMTRLAPRGSFATYVQTVHDRSDPWLPLDQELLKSIGRILLASNQRRAVVAATRRQQALMIDELNHRVRNILALIRSISRQARRHNSSLESYSHSLEQRITALAAAHNIGSHQPMRALSLRQVIITEAEPYADGNKARVLLEGNDIGVRPEAAPIVALVIHELMTNAAKYGALKSDDGQVQVRITLGPEDGVTMNWQEVGGPQVKVPTEAGFGTTLIKNAAPYELGGRSKIVFGEDGLRAELWVPKNALEPNATIDPAPGEPVCYPAVETVPEELINGNVLLVEDNFVIATDTAALLRRMSIEDVEIASTAEDGREIMLDGNVKLAILDINLGRGGSSVSLAHDIVDKGIALLFMTGYGDRAPLPDNLKHVKILTKPVSTEDLRDAITGCFDRRSRRQPV